MRELRARTSEVVHRVHDTGEVIDITEMGVVVDRFVLVPRDTTPTDEARALLEETDQLAEAVMSHWPGSASAVEAVREGIRDI